jgi:hypothetical protein
MSAVAFIIGYLRCNACLARYPYRGNDADGSDWPQHRCRGRGIQPFDKLTKEERDPLPVPPKP